MGYLLTGLLSAGSIIDLVLIAQGCNGYLIFFRSGDESMRGVEPLNIQFLLNSAETGSVLTLDSQFSKGRPTRGIQRELKKKYYQHKKR